MLARIVVHAPEILELGDVPLVQGALDPCYSCTDR